MQIKNSFNIKNLTIIFFIFVFFVGLSIFKDYGISLDEQFHKDNASFWHKYIKAYILDSNSSIARESESLIEQNIKKGEGFISAVPSIHPVPIPILYEFLLDIIQIESSKSIYQLRHLFNFIIYFVGLYFFYKIVQKRYKSYFYSLTGLLFLYLTPRFFAESFYNAQDIFFLSVTVINMYTGINFLAKPNIKNTLIFSLSSALAIDTRVMGIISVFIILFFFFLKTLRSKIFLKKNLKLLFYFFPFTLFLIIFFWPFLWTDPFNNFLFAFSELSSLKIIINNLYLGKYILSTNVPWHYHIVWIFITTPLIIILLFLLGLFFLFKRILNRLVKLDNNLNDIWRGNNEMFDIYFLMMILLPIVILMNNRLGYDGWRHLYFIYPSIIIISLTGLYYLHFIMKLKVIKFSINSLVVLNLIYLGYWNYKYHPHQNVYFNLMFKKNFHNNFDMDYWGLSNLSSIRYIIDNNTTFPIKIGTKSFSSLETSSLLLNDTDKNKISIIYSLDEADFLITNYRNRIKDDFIIDKNKYKKYYEVLVDDKAINTVYKKIIND